MWKFIFSVSLVYLTTLVLAQDTTVVSQKKPWKFEVHDIKLGANVLRAGRTFLGAGKDTQEMQAAFAFNKTNIVGDYGWERNTRVSDYSYISEGSYYRIGVDKNFVQNLDSGNVLSLGLRYARASFSEELLATIDNGYGLQDVALSNPNLTTEWLELVFNLRGKVVNNLYMGFTLRWQFSKDIEGESELKTYDIPGFGTTKRNNSTAFDYYMMWRVPFGKKAKEESEVEQE